MNSPFLFDGPGVISFSGGRTSGMMLWMTLQAYGGTLPADVVVCFANTGKEEEATWAPPAPCWGIVKKSSQKRSIGALDRLSALPASGELRKPFPQLSAKLKMKFYIRDFSGDGTKKISP
ncbi:hypothetical protein [Janthinobacterium sp. UMAB-60]|uniref:hypothetical protein n=1 Tax=Janthinobacterium sp. UMAB-60 TaxID=1365365 RepID=UPI00214C668D|nr:hypothetical protein [Janthinobacterium sp. UMAB-60]